MVGSLLARQQLYLHNLAEKRRQDKEKEEAEQAAAKQLMMKVRQRGGEVRGQAGDGL